MEFKTPTLPIDFKAYNNIMVDIETLNTTDSAVILSIAMVQFCDKTGALGAEFEIHVDPKSCIDNGGTMSWETVAWWMVQPKAAIDAVINQPIRYNILTALMYVGLFISRVEEQSKAKPFIWANAPRFDLGKIAFYYERFKLPLPWKFSHENDVRTYANRYPKLKASIQFEGVAHKAIDDCKYQIKYLCAILNSLPIATEKVVVRNSNTAPINTQDIEFGFNWSDAKIGFEKIHTAIKLLNDAYEISAHNSVGEFGLEIKDVVAGSEMINRAILLLNEVSIRTYPNLHQYDANNSR